MFLSSPFKPLKVVLRDRHQPSFPCSHFTSLHNTITITSAASLREFGTPQRARASPCLICWIQDTQGNSRPATECRRGRRWMSCWKWRVLRRWQEARWKPSSGICLALPVQRVCRPVAETALGRTGGGPWFSTCHASLRCFDLVGREWGCLAGVWHNELPVCIRVYGGILIHLLLTPNVRPHTDLQLPNLSNSPQGL